MNLTPDQGEVLDALYQIEQQQFLASDFDGWSTATDIAARLPAGHPHRQDAGWVRTVLEQLWQSRRILQVPGERTGPPTLVEVRLQGLDRHGSEDGRLALEQNDVRGPDRDAPTGHAVVAIYDPQAEVRYRSRTAELARLLSYNHQRFKMTRGTGLLRYERRDQRRPKRDLRVADLRTEWSQQVLAGQLAISIEGVDQTFALRGEINRAFLAQACDAVLEALTATGVNTLAAFQSNSVLATLAGLYCPVYRDRYDAHVVTAGVGSGKSYAFQIGALIHCAYCLLSHAPHGFRVLLLYPRVVLAANQFQELGRLIERVGQRLGVAFRPPVLDAGGQITRQMPLPDATSRFEAIQSKYTTEHNLILVSNLDTLANRLQHPETFAGFPGELDLIVGDEVHLLRGIYGSHARMLLERVRLMRALRRLRKEYPQRPMAELVQRAKRYPWAYFVGASATIAEPSRHTARLLRSEEKRVLSIRITAMESAGWVHHFFLRQKPEISTMSALVNATACLVHNRRDGLFREYYQAVASAGTVPPSLALSQLPNPVQGPAVTAIEPRNPADIHKTLGFCDSLDGVGRWSDLVADNERTKFDKGVQLNPAGNYPYFVRFQEPLWRLPHQASFATQRTAWQATLRTCYGELCRQCKKGVKCSTPRIPPNLNDAGRREVEKLWSETPRPSSYLSRLEVDVETAREPWMAPFHQARQAATLRNLDECAFFQTGLCWWSMDHVGSNAEHPPTGLTPLNGVKRIRSRPDSLAHFVNSLRLQGFTSQAGRELLELETINDIFQDDIQRVFHDRSFSDHSPENTALIIGSPRLEVGVDLGRVMDGITYRAMRDPASLQQKVGRVGREPGADSVLVHLVTQNTRDLYYFRNPQIALDPDYLQALPLHEDNRIVARHHFFMAVVDFLCLQADEAGSRKLGANGERVWVINDRALGGFGRWHEKVRACWEFLFGSHPHQAENLENLRQYLTLLGAQPPEVENAAVRPHLTSAQAPLSQRVGAIDVFWHEFGPNFLLSLITPQHTLAQICSVSADTAMAVAHTNLPRQRALLEQLGNTPDESNHLRRSYLNNIFTQPLFRRGIPLQNIAGNHPYAWTPNFFEAIGTETVRILTPNGESTYESVSTVLGLLAPGTVSYRYGSEPTKVVVASGHAATTPMIQAPGFEAVMLNVTNPDYFEPVPCGAPITGADLPPDFLGLGGRILVHTPRQLALVRASSTPLVAVDANNYGMLADNDSRPTPMPGTRGNYQEMMAPPRSYSRRWYRLQTSARAPFAWRFAHLLEQYLAPGSGRPSLPTPPVLACFEQIDFDPRLQVTDFVWGLDREFMSRNFLATRLIYQAPDGPTAPRRSVALGHQFEAPSLIFRIRTDPMSEIAALLTQILSRPDSVVYQTLLWQVLGRYLEEYGRLPVDPNAPWLGEAPPSIFNVRNLRTTIIFHLLERWHPPQATGTKPSTSPQFTIAEAAACLQTGTPSTISESIFGRLCRSVATVRNPADVTQHAASLSQGWPHLAAASAAVTPLDEAYFRKIATDILLNSLGISLHAAGLRQTGAEQEDLAYFYTHQQGVAEIFLFDTEAFGNGSIELIRNNLVIPSAERMLQEKLRQLGHVVDPLPSVDFAQCFQERLQECSSSQSAHLAYHGHTDRAAPWTKLASERDGERTRAGLLYDFLRQDLGLDSFDRLAALRECPEFLAHITATYPAYGGRSLATQVFPSYQALESAIGFCLAGCVGCLLSPETNLHGSLRARESVNKTLLDAFFGETIVGATNRGNPVARVCYPGTGVGCTCPWTDYTRVIASALGQAAQATTCTLHLQPVGGGEVLVVPVEFQVTKDGSAVTLRPDLSPVTAIEPRVRVQMQF